MSALKRGQRDVSQALEVQLENAEVEHLFHELHGLLHEMLFVAHEGKDHPNSEAVA